jgi:hypothetical protein
MEFKFNLTQLFRTDDDGIGVIKGENIPKINHSNLSIVLDAMGLASSKVSYKIIKGTKFKNYNYNRSKIYR